MVGASLYDDAGRAAYLVCFHAAQAVIFEATGRAVKTHNGVRTEFGRLTRDDHAFEPAVRTFLAEAYEYKSEADYFNTPGFVMTPEKATDALNVADRFLAQAAVAVAPRVNPIL